MENKFGRIAKFVESLEVSQLTDEQQYLLLVGGNKVPIGTGNNCQCNGNDCNCNYLVGYCGGS